MRKGILVILEGIDGSGKDTQADILVNEYGFIKTRLPLYETVSGKLVKEMIKTCKKDISEEFFQTMMLANYIEVFDTIIKPLIDSGQNVVMTRFTASMIAYSEAFGVDSSYIEAITEAILRLYERNNSVRQLYLMIPLEVSLARIESRHSQTDQKKESLFENETILKKVCTQYNNYRYFDRVFDGTKNIEEVSIRIADYLNLD